MGADFCVEVYHSVADSLFGLQLSAIISITGNHYRAECQWRAVWQLVSPLGIFRRHPHKVNVEDEKKIK